MMPIPDLHTSAGVKRYLRELHREIEYMCGCVTEHIEDACAMLEPDAQPWRMREDPRV